MKMQDVIMQDLTLACLFYGSTGFPWFLIGSYKLVWRYEKKI